MRGIGNISIIGKNGRVECSTLPTLVGVDINDRHYFHDALAKREMVLSDYVIGKAFGDPSIMAAYPTSIVNKDVEAVIVTSISLTWLEEIIGKAPAAAGMSVTLIDGGGAVLASKPPTADNSPASRAMIEQTMIAAGQEFAGSVATEKPAMAGCSRRHACRIPTRG